jgi:hypothetical protein
VKDLQPNAKALVEIKCDRCGKERLLEYRSYTSNIQRNNGKYYCLKCGTTRLDIESDIKPEFEKRDCTLISTKYSSKKPLQFICNKHRESGIQETIFDRFKISEYGCRYCAQKARNDSKKLDFKVVIDHFEINNYTLYTRYEEYNNSHSKLEFTCNKHSDYGVQTTTWANILAVKLGGCRYCANEQITLSKRLDFIVIQTAFKERGYTLITTQEEYISSKYDTASVHLS